MSKSTRKYMVNRSVYKAVKKYDHQQFEQFCSNIYMSGFEDGKNSIKSIDDMRLMEVIEGVKGIGPSLQKRIMDAIEAEFSGKGA